MNRFLYKHRLTICIAVFLMTWLTFYVNYVFIFPTPLRLENHFGFILYGFIFSVLTFLFILFKTKVASVLFLIGWGITLINLYIDLLTARIETGGSVGAALGFISNMILVIVLTILIELFVQVISKVRKR